KQREVALAGSRAGQSALLAGVCRGKELDLVRAVVLLDGRLDRDRERAGARRVELERRRSLRAAERRGEEQETEREETSRHGRIPCAAAGAPCARVAYEA